MRIFLLFIAISSFVHAQRHDTNAIMDEALTLLRNEQASWEATDHFLANYPEKVDLLIGYLSYVEESNNVVSTIFYGENNTILARYSYNNVPSSKPDGIFTVNVQPNELELELIAMRTQAMKDYQENTSNTYLYYENVSPNIIPLIYNNKRLVYIIMGTTEAQMLLGNDYKLDFNKKNEITSRTKLHNSLIPFNYGDTDNALSSVHSHIVNAVIDVTDICTLLLYKKYTGIKQHYVISKKFVSILDLEKESLLIITRKAWDKMNESEKK
ncbi:MAG: hypothetical protein NWQ19_00090 [Nonlabens sp.]|nr:hypothetical protein [Nonlabens sp.]